MESKEFLSRLRTICIDYDCGIGTHPESRYEGEAIYMHAKKGARCPELVSWDERLQRNGGTVDDER